MQAQTSDVSDCLRNVITNLPSDPDEDLWESGGIDSYAVVEMVMALEERYGISFDPETLRRENFSSLNAICNTLNRLLEQV